MSKRNRIARQLGQTGDNGEAVVGVVEELPGGEVVEETPDAPEQQTEAAPERQDEAGLLGALEAKIEEQEKQIKELEAKLAAATAPKPARQKAEEIPPLCGKPFREVARTLIGLGWTDLAIIKCVHAVHGKFVAPGTLNGERTKLKAGKAGCELTAEELAGLAEKVK